jgi:hypothetical protein
MIHRNFFAILSYFLVSACYLMIYHLFHMLKTAPVFIKFFPKLLMVVDSRTEGSILSVYPDDRFGII